MVYNKTKRIFEKVAAILAIVFFSIEILALISNYSETSSYLKYAEDVIAYDASSILIGYLFCIAFCVVGLIFAIMLVKSPVMADGTVKKRTGKRITFLVFTILCGLWVSAAFIIVVLCLKDFKATSAETQNTQVKNEETTAVSNSLDSKVQKIKDLKQTGVIDEETYKKLIVKVIKEALDD